MLYPTEKRIDVVLTWLSMATEAVVLFTAAPIKHLLAYYFKRAR